MGRVFDALRRQSTTENGGETKAEDKSTRRSEASSVAGMASSKHIEEQLLAGSKIMNVSPETVRGSRPIA